MVGFVVMLCKEAGHLESGWESPFRPGRSSNIYIYISHTHTQSVLGSSWLFSAQ